MSSTTASEDLLVVMRSVAKHLNAGTLTSEAQVRQAAVLPALRSIGWDDTDPNEVHPEYRVKGRFVDFALCVNGKPQVFVEMKAVGKLSVAAEAQMFAYAANNGIPLLVLTDGNRWEFYLSMGPGKPADRCFARCALDTTGGARALAEHLTRFLDKRQVSTQSARRAAEAELDNTINRTIARTEMAAAWEQLLAKRGGLIDDLISEEVKDRCGHKPHPDDVAAFFDSVQVGNNTRLSRPSTPPLAAAPKKRTRTAGPKLRACSVQGVEVSGDSGKQVLVKTLQHLAERDSGFLAKMAAHPQNAPRNRGFLSKDKDSLYKTKRPPHEYAEIADGWWAGTNLSIRQIAAILERACEVAGMRWGDDFHLVWEQDAP